MEQLESQNLLSAEVNSTYNPFPKYQTGEYHYGNTRMQSERLHNVYPTQKKSVLLRRTPLPILTKWTTATGFKTFIG